MALVHDRQRIRRQVIEQRRRGRARRPAGQMPRVVFDPVAIADLLDHLQVEHRPLVQAVRLEDLPLGFELGPVPVQFFLDGLDRELRLVARRDEVRLGIDRHLVVLALRPAGQGIEGDELVHLVAEQLDANRHVFVRGIDLDDVAAHAERAPVELVVVPLVLDLDQLPQDAVPVDALTALERQHHPVIGLRRTETIDA